MGKESTEEALLRQLGELERIETSKELSKIIVRIVDLVALLDLEIQADVRKWRRAELNLERLAALAELDIKDRQIQKIRREVLRIIKESTNRLVLATIKPGRN